MNEDQLLALIAEELPHWKLTIDEVSNGVYRTRLTDSFGRIAETTDASLTQGLAQVRQYALDVEEQLARRDKK